MVMLAMVILGGCTQFSDGGVNSEVLGSSDYLLPQFPEKVYITNTNRKRKISK